MILDFKGYHRDNSSADLEVSVMTLIFHTKKVSFYHQVNPYPTDKNTPLDR